MTRRLTDKKIEEMFLAYQEKQSLAHVQRKCKVSLPTIKKYKDEGEWDERLKRVRQKTIEKVDARIASYRARHINLAKLMQVKGAKRLQEIPDAHIDGRLAKDLIRDGITIEREALGDYSPDFVIKVELPEGLEI